jgi:hypothetical protein
MAYIQQDLGRVTRLYGRKKGTSNPESNPEHTTDLAPVSGYGKGKKRHGVVSTAQTELNLRSAPSIEADLYVAYEDSKYGEGNISRRVLTQGQKVNYYLLRDVPRWAYVVSTKGTVLGYAARESSSGVIRINEIGNVGPDTWMIDGSGYVPEEYVEVEEIISPAPPISTLPTLPLEPQVNYTPYLIAGGAVAVGSIGLAFLSKRKKRKK